MSFESKVYTGLMAVVLTAMLVLANTGLLPNYSTGSRIGVVDKISEKGIINKSFEGEMKMVGMSANAEGQLVQNVFAFSVRDKAIAEKIEAAAAQNKPIKLHYSQWLVNPRFKQDTKYTVTGVE